MLEISNISFSYPGRKKSDVLRDFSLTLLPGNICGLLGPNGAGKSTLLYLISGLLSPRQGFINCNGFTPRDRKTAFLRDIFLVPEVIELPRVSLDTYVSLNAPFYPRFSMEILKKCLDMFELSHDIHLASLSMGQRKKAFIAFALAANTSLILMDEPANGLDIPGKSAFRRAVVESMSDDKCVIISTHQVHDIDRIIDHVVTIDSESVRLNASTVEIASRLAFSTTTDAALAAQALVSLPVPGGYNIVTLADGSDAESEVDLETLFLLSRNHPDIITKLFPLK
ncbi:MAG: ATP-binding cassette domain-containing protein [Pseudoflavonifractor sp.]|nr:ATP-binding cassette domain-containing protein [Alloprevotella sp.]MCM1117319.1 ATP-binding cassette domain-containing protein [Pseudoflavonifractor sp.]